MGRPMLYNALTIITITILIAALYWVSKHS